MIQRRRDDELGFRLFYTNDLHGDRAIWKAFEKELLECSRPYFCLDGGDAIRGSHTVFRWHEPNLATLAKLGFQAQTMGNRELSYLRFVLMRRAWERKIPLLSCNVEILRGGNEVFFEGGLHPLWQSHVTFECGGFRIGVTGALVVQYPVGSPWERFLNLRFHEPYARLEQEIAHLRESCDLVIVMSHCGMDQDLVMLEKGLKPDLMLCAHTHDLTEEPIWVEGIPCVQGGSHGRYLTYLDYEAKDQRWSWHYKAMKVEDE